MADAGRHPNITLITLSEVKDVTGFVGNFHVRVLKRARYVSEKECTACGDCANVCPVIVPDEFNMGLNTRRAIYSPFPQAVPSAYAVDINQCLGHNPIICGKCIEACKRHCVDFSMNDEELSFDVGTIVMATGAQPIDPTFLEEYGYSRYSNVLTSMEFERLINAGGPTRGEVIRLSDRKRPHSVAFIQCVGSRSTHRGHPYCSNICCMNTVKSAIMLKEHYPDLEVKVFYIDIRAVGKGFEDLFRRSKALGVRYIRGLPGSVHEDTDTQDLMLTVENTATNTLERHRVEMVVLAIGLEPPEDVKVLQEMLALQRNADGFYLEAHPKLQPVDSASRGIFFAGCAEGPKDIKESVTQASAAAARALRLMAPGAITVEALTAMVDESLCTACGLCARVCPYHAITVDTKTKTPARITQAACAGCGNCAAECPQQAVEMSHFTDAQIEAQIDAILADDPIGKVLVFACNWCSYAGADYAGVSRLPYPPTNRLIRTMCSARVSERFVWHAFGRGAPVVLVSGCHFGDCHYINANHWTKRRVERIWKRMEKLGLRKERLGLEWISAAEGMRFQRVMTEMERIRQTVTEEEIKRTREIITAEVEKKTSLSEREQGNEKLV
jgi:heterodisulfide reductase subunit A